MKKVLVLLFVLVFNACVCFADDVGYVALPVCKPIPAYSKAIYKSDIEHLLTIEIPKVQKEIDSMVTDAYKLKIKLLRKKNITPNDDDYIKLLNIMSYESFIIPFNNLYSKIIETTNKYLDTPITDTKNTEHYIFCYQDDNNIDKSWNNDLTLYLGAKLEIINGYISDVEKNMCYKLPQQYKTDIENTIKVEVPKAYKNVDQLYTEALNIYKSALYNKKEHNSYKEQLSGYVDYIYNPEFDLYCKLIEVTRKYAYIPEYKTGTDWVGTLYAVLEPYIRDNKINMQQIDDLSEYCNKKQLEIEKMLSDL